MARQREAAEAAGAIRRLHLVSTIGVSMLIRTSEGWKPLRRMYVADLREASRRLPGASKAEIVDLADQIFSQSKREGPRTMESFDDERATKFRGAARG